MKSFSKSKEITIHLLYWLCFLLERFVVLNSSRQFILEVKPFDYFDLSFMAVAVSTFYINYSLVLRKFFDIKVPSKYFLGVLLIFSYFIFSRYLIEEVIYPHLIGTGNYFSGTPFWYYIFDNLHWGSSPIIVSTIIWLVINFIRTLQKEVSLNEEKKKAEIQFLKSQINPHFIFNTLNNIYSLVFRKSDQALPAIEKLSEIMRFTTYETQKELIPIGSELNYIESFIDLEKIRNSKEINIKIKLDIVDKNQAIPPYLMLPFIENCIKHGILDDTENPVLFSVQSNSKKLIIKIENKINHKLKDAHSGIGMSNLEKRLEYYYPIRHLFEVSNDGSVFKSHLEIPLQP